MGDNPQNCCTVIKPLLMPNSNRPTKGTWDRENENPTAKYQNKLHCFSWE